MKMIIKILMESLSIHWAMIFSKIIFKISSNKFKRKRKIMKKSNRVPHSQKIINNNSLIKKPNNNCNK